MTEQYPDLIRSLVFDAGRFVEAILREIRLENSDFGQRITIRPVTIKSKRLIQFIYFDGVQEIAKNFSPAEAANQLNDLLALPAKSIQVKTTTETLLVQFSKKGRPIVHRHPHTSDISIPLTLTHDRQKPYILADDEPIPFLKAIGVMNADGRVRADQRRKFRQINEFLRLIDETGAIEHAGERPLQVVDLGCGSAALTFATYDYLNRIKRVPANMIGVDTKGQLIDRLNETAHALEWTSLSFHKARILDYEPPGESPQLVLALHACNTATDEALAQSIHWGSKLIFSAPCCHHHLQAQLAKSDVPSPFQPVMRHGILRERLGDILTDTFRALLLRLAGYRTDVMEFITVEHTPKNLMIRAVYTGSKPSSSLIDEYHQLKSFWGVTPYLETLIRDKLDPIFS